MSNKAWGLLLGGLVIMIMSLCLEAAVQNQLISNNGPGGLNKIVIVSRLQLDSDKNRNIIPDDINFLRKKLPGVSLSYLARQDTSVEGNQQVAKAKLLGINYQYTGFCDLNMVAGGMWTEAAEQEGQRAAVISADLATQLFGSQDVLGMDIDILGMKFLITGVFTPQTGILASLTGDGIPEVYIPGAAFYKLVKNPVIREVQIESLQPSNIDVSESISDILLGMGKDPTSFAIIDYHDTRVLMGQAPKIQIFIIGMVVILVLLRVMKDNTRGLVQLCREDCREHYFNTVIKKRWREIVGYLVVMAGLLVVILFIWNRIHFHLYIPPRYIPDDLINISHFTEVIKQDISAGQKMTEYYPPGPELQLGVGSVINRILYYLAWPLGLGLVLYALTGVRWNNVYSLLGMRASVKIAKKKVGRCNE